MSGGEGSIERPRLRLVVASFLMLFVELALIRGTAANVTYLSWFTNFVLLGSFLGIGVGFLRMDPTRDRSRWASPILAALTVFVVLFPVWIGHSYTRSAKLVMLDGLPALPAWLELGVIFVGVVAVMACIADEVARAFTLFEPLEAYRLDVVGSLAGIAAFSVSSFLGWGPGVWAVVAVACLLALSRRPFPAVQLASLAVLAVVLIVLSFAPRSTWSPYNRVSWNGPTSTGELAIRVNGRPHQTIVPVDRLVAERPFYGFVYRHVPPTNHLANVLVIGAGSGDDVALALSMGAQHVDAVEIDPVIQQLGRDYHPSRPYQDPRVTVHIDDGRAFLEQSDARYDLILFALPDSLTLVSGQGSLRLESYLFTRESVEAARAHLASDGILSMYNYYSPLVFDRYAETLTQVFGTAPCVDRGTWGTGIRSQSVLTVGLTPANITCSTTWTAPANPPAPATDDHPFPYVAGRSIPVFYLVTMGLILVASIALVRISAGGAIGGALRYADLFFMGAAFLLLETKNVVGFALLFGTTWFVNSLVFAGILLSVLAAVECVQRVRTPRPAVLYLALFVSLAVAWAIHPDALLTLSPLPRFAAASALAFAPVFLANVIFAQRFKDVGSSTTAFGANLLGAMVGGILEYASIAVGYRALLLVVAALYLLALVTTRRSGAASIPDPV
jgi:hypothetical protein